MHVLLLGGTGNLGSRMVPALLANGHTVVAYIRSEAKLRSLISPALFDQITIHVGDALDTNAVQQALRKHGCDAIMCTAENYAGPFREQYIGKIAAAVSGAAIRVGKDRGTVLKAWFIGGLGSLEIPGSGGKKVDHLLPGWGAVHHQETETAVRTLRVSEIEWTLLCVAWMTPESKTVDVWSAQRKHALAVQADVVPGFELTRFGWLLGVGGPIDLFWNIFSYTTKLEDVAQTVAENMAKEKSIFAGQLIGMRDQAKVKTS